MTRSEFLKAIRALSSCYVERRGRLSEKSPMDSAGKRAAFAGFYAPLHFLTVRAIVTALGPSSAPAAIVDLGCGTGVAGAAWALACARPPHIAGIDVNQWALDEARDTWRSLGLTGRAQRGSLLAELDRITRAPRTRDRPPGLILGWSLNELDRPSRAKAQTRILDLAGRGASVLIVEPVARRLVPWWDDFAERAVAAGARSDEWRFTDPLPPALAELDRDAGFEREGLTARSVAFGLSQKSEVKNQK